MRNFILKKFWLHRKKFKINLYKLKVNWIYFFFIILEYIYYFFLFLKEIL
jgi:hypothetical protein